jgi:hypothetical protein
MKSLFFHWETLGVAQLEGTIQDPDFLGTVAPAGASDLEDGLDSVRRAKIHGLVAFWVYGVKTVYPELDLKDLLTSKALAIYNACVEDRCSAASGAFAPLSTDQIFLPGWKKNEYIQEFLKRDKLVGGGDDILFSESASRKVLHRLCTAGARVQRNVYSGLGDDLVVYGSLREQLDCIAARFAGEPPPGNCPAPQAFNGRDGPGRKREDRQLLPRW